MRTMVVQLAGWLPGRANAASNLIDWLDERLTGQDIELVVLSELALTPYFPTSTDRTWLGRGTSIDAEEISQFGRLARRHSTHITLPFAEVDGRGCMYNSVALIGKDGESLPCKMVSGSLAGEMRLTYRKTHLSENRNADPGVHEKYYFTPGVGLSLWSTPIGDIAPLICYDRSFPEAWRVVADAGALVVVIPIATSRPERIGMLERELSVEANHNGVFAVAACKAGSEVIGEGCVTYSGGSFVVDPFGEVIGRAPPIEGDVAFTVDIDLDRVKEWNLNFHYRRDRRPSVYQHPGQYRLQGE